jgi:hypothetical protein
MRAVTSAITVHLDASDPGVSDSTHGRLD